MAGVNVIARRVEELADRYGADVLAHHVDGYLDYAERRLRDELRQIPGAATGAVSPSTATEWPPGAPSRS